MKKLLTNALQRYYRAKNRDCGSQSLADIAREQMSPPSLLGEAKKPRLGVAPKVEMTTQMGAMSNVAATAIAGGSTGSSAPQAQKPAEVQ